MKNDFTALNATFETMPMALGGGNPAEPEFRLASFKGALRFWWRVLRWKDVEKAKEKIKELHKLESEIFGSSDPKFGQSKVRLRLLKPVDSDTKNIRDYFDQNSGGLYLGYGIDAAKPKRKLLGEFSFQVEIRLSPLLSPEQKRQVEEAIRLMGTLGGLGSSSRKGFGSLNLIKLEGGTASLQILENLMKFHDSSALPDWTAWSEGTRVFSFERKGDWKNLVNSWGTFLKTEIGEMKKEDRCKMGSPRKSGNCSERRGSPIFFHVSKIEKGMRGRIAFFPSLFLPGKPKQSTDGYFWKPVDELIDSARENFNAKEIGNE